jgi:RHS repeat-associated protein
VYDIAGRNIAEYSSEPPESDETLWLFTDILGSVRAITGEKPEMDPAPVLECYDYLPFGRMLTGQDNGRSGPGCYPGSPAAYTSAADEKFTGQKRDEFLLDYFIARYYSGAQGRFTSADLPFMDQSPDDPQSWNLYGYVRNNPLRYVDPTGYACAAEDGECITTSQNLTSLLELLLLGLDARANGLVSSGEKAVERLEEIYVDHRQRVVERNELAEAEFNLCIRYGIACPEIKIGMVIVAPGTGGIFGAGRAGSAFRAAAGARLLTNSVGKAINILRPGGRLIGRAGTSSRIRILQGGQAEARALFRHLVQETGATSFTKVGFPGNAASLPGGGGTIGFRAISSSGLPTIDVNIPGLAIREIKFLLP